MQEIIIRELQRSGIFGLEVIGNQGRYCLNCYGFYDPTAEQVLRDHVDPQGVLSIGEAGFLRVSFDAAGDVIDAVGETSQDQTILRRHEFAAGLDRVTWFDNTTYESQGSGTWSRVAISPVPLPASGLLALAAFSLLGFRRRT